MSKRNTHTHTNRVSCAANKNARHCLVLRLKNYNFFTSARTSICCCCFYYDFQCSFPLYASLYYCHVIMLNKLVSSHKIRVIMFTCASRIDASKSTKGASKLRRDLINAEIANLRDLLPLPPSTRQRLSQLQLMALVCVFLRKANYFQQGNYTFDYLLVNVENQRDDETGQKR